MANQDGTTTMDADEESMMLFDHCIVQKPPRLTDDRSKWSEWRFDFENFMTLVDAHYATEMAWAVSHDTMISDERTVSLRRRSLLMYAVLSSLTSGKAKMMVRKLHVTRNGFEAW